MALGLGRNIFFASKVATGTGGFASACLANNGALVAVATVFDDAAAVDTASAGGTCALAAEAEDGKGAGLVVVAEATTAGAVNSDLWIVVC